MSYKETCTFKTTIDHDLKFTLQHAINKLGHFKLILNMDLGL